MRTRLCLWRRWVVVGVLCTAWGYTPPRIGDWWHCDNCNFPRQINEQKKKRAEVHNVDCGNNNTNQEKGRGSYCGWLWETNEWIWIKIRREGRKRTVAVVATVGKYPQMDFYELTNGSPQNGTAKECTTNTSKYTEHFVDSMEGPLNIILPLVQDNQDRFNEHHKKRSNWYRQTNLWSLLNKPWKECGKVQFCGWTRVPLALCSITFDRINYWAQANLIPSLNVIILLLLYLYVNHCMQIPRDQKQGPTNISDRFSPLD